MKSVEIVGFQRANLGKTDSKALRAESNVPCVLYGGEEQIHFYVPVILFRPLVYTPNAHVVDLNIEGRKFTAILQDIQFHPVNESILHADFLQLFEDKQVKINVPVKVMALPAQLPDFVEVDVAHLDLGKTVKVSSIVADGFTILAAPNVPVVTIDIPRALKSQRGN